MNQYKDRLIHARAAKKTLTAKIYSATRQTLSPEQAQSISRAPPTCRGAIARCYEQRASPRQAIKAKCLDCTNFDRKEIAECQIDACPLWTMRPFAIKSNADAEGRMKTEATTGAKK